MTLPPHNPRKFICSCGYFARVQGGLYLDKDKETVLIKEYGASFVANLDNFLFVSERCWSMTKVCPDCKVLFDDLIKVPSTIDEARAVPQIRELIDTLDLVAEERQTKGCPICGQDSKELWVEQYPVCPKCGGMMKEE